MCRLRNNQPQHHDSVAGGFPCPSIAAIPQTGQAAFFNACVITEALISKQEQADVQRLLEWINETGQAEITG